MKIRYLSVLLLVLGLILSACSAEATEEPAVAAPENEVTEPAETADSAPEEDPEPEESVVEGENETLSEGEVSFELDPELTQARFIIGEILANAPNTVIGVTSDVQGSGILNSVDPQSSSLGVFQIDASSFVTDSALRDRAIREFILQSGQHPEIKFEPTEITGIPDAITVGETVPFEVVGLLTIRDLTQEVTFAGEATMISEDRVEGLASATVMRGDFELTIPSVPRVAGVDEDFILEIEFVAVSS